MLGKAFLSKRNKHKLVEVLHYKHWGPEHESEEFHNPYPSGYFHCQVCKLMGSPSTFIQDYKCND